MSCSSMGATMSLRPITSCDFVTRLPVCPSNGLPLFKDFPADEVARPERYVQTPDYAALRDLAVVLTRRNLLAEAETLLVRADAP